MSRVIHFFLPLYLCCNAICFAQELYFVSDNRCKIKIIYKDSVYFNFKVDKGELKYFGKIPIEMTSGNSKVIIKRGGLLNTCQGLILTNSIQPFLFIVREKGKYSFYWSPSSEFYFR